MKLKKITLLLILTFICTISAYCESLSIMHWNIANAFDTIEEPKKNDTVLSPEEYNDKMIVFGTIVLNILDVKNRSKYWNPTHSLFHIPKLGLKFLNAI